MFFLDVYLEFIFLSELNKAAKELANRTVKKKGVCVNWVSSVQQFLERFLSPLHFQSTPSSSPLYYSTSLQIVLKDIGIWWLV